MAKPKSGDGGNRTRARFHPSDTRAIGVERRPTGATPEVELVLIRLNGRDAELVLDDGESLVFDAAELRKALEPFDPKPLRAVA